MTSRTTVFGAMLVVTYQLGFLTVVCSLVLQHEISELLWTVAHTSVTHDHVMNCVRCDLVIPFPDLMLTNVSNTAD